jgi:hypothetical protein
VANQKLDNQHPAVGGHRVCQVLEDGYTYVIREIVQAVADVVYQRAWVRDQG